MDFGFFIYQGMIWILPVFDSLLSLSLPFRSPGSAFARNTYTYLLYVQYLFKGKLRESKNPWHAEHTWFKALQIVLCSCMCISLGNSLPQWYLRYLLSVFNRKASQESRIHMMILKHRDLAQADTYSHSLNTTPRPIHTRST